MRVGELGDDCGGGGVLMLLVVFVLFNIRGCFCVNILRELLKITYAYFML